jgi:hypothetical protein
MAITNKPEELGMATDPQISKILNGILLLSQQVEV